MQQATPLQQAIMLSSIIGSLLSHYDVSVAKERLKPIQIMRARIKKFMYKRSRSNKQDFHGAVSSADLVWKNSVNHFAEHNIKIEAVSTIIRLYDLYAEPLSRFTNINEKQMESYAQGQTSAVTGEIEAKSFEVSDFILDQLSAFTGIKRINKLKTKFTIIKQNIIIERG